MLSILFFGIPGGAHFCLPASMEELGDQSKVVFALFVMAVIYIEGLVCVGEGGRIIAPSFALPTKIDTST